MNKNNLNRGKKGQLKTYPYYKKFKVNDLLNKTNSFKKRIDIKRVLLFIQNKPYTSFFIVLAIFLAFMVLGNLFFSTKPAADQNQTIVKKVQVFSLGNAPQVSYQGKIEKSGVVKIIAQMPGIVQYVNVSEGQNVYRGQTIISLATNYQGGNVLSLSRQIAQTQYQNTKDNFNSQLDLIKSQRDLANKSKDNSDQLRDITNKTVEDTQNLINLNQSIVDILNQNLLSLSTSDPLYLQTKSQIAQFQSVLLQLNGSIRNLQYQGASDKPPADLTNLQKDIAIRGLDLSEKALNMNLEISKLSYNLALVNEANMYTSSPFNGVVDRILVHSGESVNPGTVIANISGDSQHASVVVSVPGEIAKNVSKLEPSIIELNGKNIFITPDYVSKDATNGSLYSIIYNLDDSLTGDIIDESYVNVKIPIGIADTTNFDPYIPLDSVIQTQEESFVYIIDKNQTAKVIKINLGQIQGKYVQVLSGLPKNSQVILNRNIIEGDKVQIIK
jgi:multidrug efflux pump subunit AcrA (membrane-fusion protein)